MFFDSRSVSSHFGTVQILRSQSDPVLMSSPPRCDYIDAPRNQRAALPSVFSIASSSDDGIGVIDSGAVSTIYEEYRFSPAPSVTSFVADDVPKNSSSGAAYFCICEPRDRASDAAASSSWHQWQPVPVGQGPWLAAPSDTRDQPSGAPAGSSQPAPVGQPTPVGHSPRPVAPDPCILPWPLALVTPPSSPRRMAPLRRTVRNGRTPGPVPQAYADRVFALWARCPESAAITEL